MTVINDNRKKLLMKGFQNETLFLLSTTNQVDSLHLRNIFGEIYIHEERKGPCQTFIALIPVKEFYKFLILVEYIA